MGRSVPYCRKLGHGRTLVVAGGVHLDHAYLTPWLDPIAEFARLVYFDHRGTGRSGLDGGPSELSHDRWVEEIDRLRAALGAERIILLGHSYGGFLAQLYALAFGDRLDGLILCSTAPAMDYPEVVMANAEAAESPDILAAVQRALGAPSGDDATLRRLWMEILPLYWHRYVPEVAADLDRRTTYSATAFDRAYFECLPGFSTVGRLNGIRVPVLLLTGRHDWICPPEQGAMRIQQEIPAAGLTIFERSGHFPFIEESERFVSTVADWLEALPGG